MAIAKKQTRPDIMSRRVALTDAGVDGGARADRNCQFEKQFLFIADHARQISEPNQSCVLSEVQNRTLSAVAEFGDLPVFAIALGRIGRLPIGRR
jgi:hypothetical protein